MSRQKVRNMSRRQQKAVFANMGNPSSSAGSSDRDKVLEREFGKKSKPKKRKGIKGFATYIKKRIKGEALRKGKPPTFKKYLKEEKFTNLAPLDRRIGILLHNYKYDVRREYGRDKGGKMFKKEEQKFFKKNKLKKFEVTTESIAWGGGKFIGRNTTTEVAKNKEQAAKKVVGGLIDIDDVTSIIEIK